MKFLLGQDVPEGLTYLLGALNHEVVRLRDVLPPEATAAMFRRELAGGAVDRYIAAMRFEKVWIEQCRATRGIKRRFGARSALDYLIGEKLLAFADAAEDDPEFAAELPRFLSAIYRVFNQYEIAGYVSSRKPAARKVLRQLLLTH